MLRPDESVTFVAVQSESLWRYSPCLQHTAEARQRRREAWWDAERCWEPLQAPVLSFVSLCLPHRLTYDSLAALEIPSDLLQTIQDLVLDLRVRCVVATLQHTAEGASGTLTALARQQLRTRRLFPVPKPSETRRELVCKCECFILSVAVRCGFFFLSNPVYFEMPGHEEIKWILLKNT